MVARDARKLVLWPHYFDRNLTRAQGRRVRQDLSVDHPSAGAVAQAARSLGLKVEYDEKARPPPYWHGRPGRVLVQQTGEKKEKILESVARRL